MTNDLEENRNGSGRALIGGSIREFAWRTIRKQ
jgi:hypothetical protein